MRTVAVSPEYLSALRSLQTIVACSDDEVIAKLEGNVPLVLEAIEREENAAPVHPIDSVQKFNEIPGLVGVVSNEDYDALIAAWSILRGRASKYRQAIDAVDAWSESHDQGEVWNQLVNQYAELMVAARIIKVTTSNRPTSDWCRAHPGESGCPA